MTTILGITAILPRKVEKKKKKPNESNQWAKSVSNYPIF